MLVKKEEKKYSITWTKLTNLTKREVVHSTIILKKHNCMCLSSYLIVTCQGAQYSADLLSPKPYPDERACPSGSVLSGQILPGLPVNVVHTTELQLLGTALVISLDGHSGNLTVCPLAGMPADQARSCGQAFRCFWTT